MKKLIFVVLIMVGLLVGPALGEVPDLLLGQKVRVIFEEELPSGHHHLDGRVLTRDGDWLVLVDSGKRIYWCSVSRIVYIEMLRIEQGGENEDFSLDVGSTADLYR